MCKPKAPKVQKSTQTVQRLAAPPDDAVIRESEIERSVRRARSGVAADILTSPLGL
jgi:hypothetical protein